MPTYVFRCEACANVVQHYWTFEEHDTHRGSALCEVCGGESRQLISSPSFHRGMSEHWNTALGNYVSNERQFKDGLKIASENATMLTGVEHNYQPVDLKDTKRLGVTEEGLDATRAAQVKAGTREVRSWL